MSDERTSGDRGRGAAGGGSGGAGPEGEHPGDGHEGHASVRFYWMIGGILAILTAMEVAAYYMTLEPAIEVPFLLVLSAAKFVLVVMFFMHLKFDSRVFTFVFLAGLALATLMTGSLIILYHVLPYY